MAFPWQATVQDQTGAIAPLAVVTVRNGSAAGSLATLFSDEAGTALANPFNADANALAQFWAETGVYYITATVDGQTTDGWYISLGGGSAVLTVTTTEDVTAYSVVTTDGALCDEADIAKMGGIAQADAVSGEGVNVVRTGTLTNGDWTWTAGAPIYVADGGVLTQTVTGDSRQIAYALSATQITVDIFPYGVNSGGSGKEDQLVFTNSSGFIAASLLDLSSLYADPAADPASDNDGLIPLLDAAGLLPSEYVPVSDISSNTGGAGSEDSLVRADENGDIDPTFLGNVINTAKQMVASGAIAAGAAVGIVGDGVVKEIGLTLGSYSAVDTGTMQTHVGDYGYEMSVDYDKTQNCFVFCYSDAGNSYYPTVVAATLVGTTLTFGTPVVIESNASDTTFVHYHAQSGRTIVLYDKTSDSKAYYNVLTLSGTSITVNTSAAISTATVYNTPKIASDPTAAEIVFIYTESGSPYQLACVAGTVSGTTITMGTPVDVTAADQAFVSDIVYDASSSRYVIAYQVSDDDDLLMRTLTLVGTSITYNSSTVAYNGTSVSGLEFHMDVNPSTGEILVAFMPGSTTMYTVTGSVTGATVIMNSPIVTTPESGYSYRGSSGVIYDNLTDQWIIMGYTTNGGTDYAFVMIASMASEVLSVDSINYEENGYSTVSQLAGKHCCFDPDTQQVMFLMRTHFSHNNPLIIDPASAVSNIGTFCGFAKTGAADTETLIVDSEGDVNASQTGLTEDTDYYLAGDGTLSASDTGYGVIGRAWSDTQLEITNGRISL
jgi:hypothetical protein